MSACDVAIVGAGPYGLSAAAHLRAANGLDVRVFGEPMSFWERHMPKGMLLRSPLEGSHSWGRKGSTPPRESGAACPWACVSPRKTSVRQKHGHLGHRRLSGARPPRVRKDQLL